MSLPPPDRHEPVVLVAARPVPSVLFNFAAFQLGWFSCVLGAANGMPTIGPVVAAAIVSFHVARAARPAEELKLVASALVIGAAWDSALVISGTLGFTSGAFAGHAAPPWILALWALLATTLNVSLRWLHGRWLLAAVLGAIAGPLSYWAGVRFGAVAFLEPVPAIAALAVGWGVMMPVLIAIARSCDGIGRGR